MASSPVDELARVHDDAERLVAGVREDQWDAPTPCTEWTVRDLVGHLVGGDRVFAAVLRGDAASPMEAARPADPLGDDPVAAYRAAADEMLAEFRRPGVLERVVTLPIGPAPGVVAAQLRIVETLVHGWDLARATGQHLGFPDDIVERALELTRARLSDVPPERSPFAPPQPVPDDAPPIDRLAAALGRLVTDRPD